MFKLKNECFTLDHIVTIYDYFRNFNCIGKYDYIDGVGEEYIFKVQYEGFQYRKIHEIVLALQKWIDVPSKDLFHKADDVRDIQEQKCQSELLQYRSAEGKEKLKQEIEKYLNRNNREG